MDYIFIISRLLNVCLEINCIFTIGAIEALIDLVLFDAIFCWLPSFSDKTTNILGTIIMCYNLLFFTYFYAKLCGLYKLFKEYKFWQKFLIFSLLSILIYPIAMFDFRNFRMFDNFYTDDNNETIILTCLFVLPAFFLNLFFNFLTKKFPKPFEKIGYWCSLEFFKSLIKTKK